VPRHATLTPFATRRRHPRSFGRGRAIDQAVVTFFPRRRRTGEDVVDRAHGSPVVLNRIVTMAMAAGAAGKPR
jgi:tRNA U34 5-carboxymethylaminomethyl modifying GTPase MnmE/TrmE